MSLGKIIQLDYIFKFYGMLSLSLFQSDLIDCLRLLYFQVFDVLHALLPVSWPELFSGILPRCWILTPPSNRVYSGFFGDAAGFFSNFSRESGGHDWHLSGIMRKGEGGSD